ncbi:MAG TPA: plastocyanin/azurin family copper-binding protein [Candidatus Sulfotelmatobacter sp.]|nr:plastocyanin/azurin family copper-binding protein [Candidatus Sulfotelmatobacter sp.]
MKIFNTIRVPHCLLALLVLSVFGVSQNVDAQQNWQAKVGAQTPSMGRQALAFLPNEMWIHAGDSITWTFNSDEIHTVSFLVVGQIFPPFPLGCPGFSVGVASFDGSTCVTTPPSVKPETFTVTFPVSGNYKIQCLVHNTMNGRIHVLDPSTALPHHQAFYDAEAARETRDLLTDGDRATSSDMADMHMSHGQNSVSVRVLAATQRLSSDGKNLAPSSGPQRSASAHVSAGVGEIASTPGGLQTNSLVRFVKDKIEIHAGDTIEWSNFDPEEPHTITFGQEPQNMFAPSPGVTIDADGGLSATLNSPGEDLHSGFILQALDDQPGTPVNSNLNNSISLNHPRFRVKFTQPGTYNYKCVLHDNLGMVGQVIVLP